MVKVALPKVTTLPNARSAGVKDSIPGPIVNPELAAFVSLDVTIN
jgi:hypothetical protein